MDRYDGNLAGKRRYRSWPRTPNRGTVAIILPSLAMSRTAVSRWRGDPFQIYCRPGDAAPLPTTLPRSRPGPDLGLAEKQSLRSQGPDIRTKAKPAGRRKKSATSNLAKPVDRAVHEARRVRQECRRDVQTPSATH